MLVDAQTNSRLSAFVPDFQLATNVVWHIDCRVSSPRSRSRCSVRLIHELHHQVRKCRHRHVRAAAGVVPVDCTDIDCIAVVVHIAVVEDRTTPVVLASS